MNNVIVFLIFFFSFSVKSHAQDKEIVFGFHEFPPLAFTNKDGVPDGTMIRKVKSMFEELGFNYKFESVPRKRLSLYLKEGKIDLWIDREKPNKTEFGNYVILNNKPIDTIHMNIYSIDKPIIKKVNNLIKHRLILIRGYDYNGLLDSLKRENNVMFFETKSHKSGLQMLEAKRADYFIGYGEPSQFYLKTKAIPNLSFTLFYKMKLYLFASERLRENKKIIASLSNYLK